LKGHDLSRADEANRMIGALQAAEKGQNIVDCSEQMQQGLKPALYFVAFAARLKSCPCYKTGRNRVFPQAV
jgi:hypothetical protein